MTSLTSLFIWYNIFGSDNMASIGIDILKIDRIEKIKAKYVDNSEDGVIQAGEGAAALLQRLKDETGVPREDNRTHDKYRKISITPLTKNLNSPIEVKIGETLIISQIYSKLTSQLNRYETSYLIK